MLQAKQAQRMETRQLGIRDPLPPQLSSSNALLKSLAQGANRVSSQHPQDCVPLTGARPDTTGQRRLL